MDDSTKIVAEHYQKTYELTLQMWEQRNTTFILLLAVVGAAALLTFNVPQAEPLLVDVVAKVVGISDPGRLKELRQSFPYAIIHSILLMIVLYLMVILYHRTAFITRCYFYLSEIESELRRGLGLRADAVAFTRESIFYRSHKAPYSQFVAITYIGMLGLLLLGFLSFRIYADFASGNTLFGVVDLLLSIPTLIFFAGYARMS